MRISDWSSDVCSSDLHLADRPCGATGASLCRQAFGPPDRQLDGRSMNETIVKFGHPATLIAEYEHWVVLLRPAQPTLGALILAAKSDATAFGDLPTEAHTELKTATTEIGRAAGRERVWQYV